MSRDDDEVQRRALIEWEAHHRRRQDDADRVWFVILLTGLSIVGVLWLWFGQ